VRELWIHVADGPDKRPLLVKLPDGELEDVGTTFSVLAENRRTARVSVEEGRVVLRLRRKQPPLRPRRRLPPTSLPTKLPWTSSVP
jgi:ferric-dicitrate binding protein FerR (iron transport regulator)